MLLLGAHRINHGTFDVQICRLMQQRNTLIVGTSTMYGAGVYAYYPDRLPGRLREDPFVIFQAVPVRAQIELAAIILRRGTAPDIHFFVLRGTIGTALPVAVLGFVNCPGFPAYPGQLSYV